MSGKPSVNERRDRSSGPASSTWWIVFKRELADLWIAGRALTLTLIYTVVLGAMTYLLATNSELSLIPPKEAVYETLKTAIAFSLFIGLIIGADSLSGERERNTFEGLLLTPASRRQIVVGKLLAAVSPWPVALLITIPYLAVLSQGDEVLGPAVLWGAITGSVLAPAYTGLGMLVSLYSNNNKTSYFVNLALYIFLLVPAQLPGRAQTGAAGQFVQWVNPLAAVNHFLSKHLVNYRPLSEYWTWLTSPVVFAVLILGLLILYASPGLGLEAGKSSRFTAIWRRVAGLFALAGLVATVGARPVLAFEGSVPPAAATTAAAASLQVGLDTQYRVVKTGDKVEFNTSVTNNAGQATPPLIVAMNVINLDAQGDVVDPEDWSPQRTQYLTSLAPGQSASLAWIINTILDGNYMVYMVVIPEPSGTESTSLATASPGLHLTVTPFTRLNPAGILPYAVGGPVLLVLATFAVYRWRNRQIDTGAAG